MRIGLIGINKYAKFLNFACDLHAYAFQQFLLQHGYESTFLDYKPAYFGNFDMRHPAEITEQRYKDAVLTKKSVATRKKWADLAIGYRSVEEERERRFDKFESFVEKRLNFTEDTYDSDLLEINDPGFDCYICVTDVIWQSIPTHMFDRGFLLGSKAFDGKAKIAYAASRGASDDFSAPQLEKFSEYLERIDSISVREDDFREYLETNTAASVTTVLDPVLLHDRIFWDEVAVTPQEQGYVLLYYVMEQSSDTIAKAVEYAKFHDLTLVELSDRPLKFGRVSDTDVKHIARYDVGMDEWLGYIQGAEAVFTNSFHGCCFSIIFETPFFVGARNGQKVPNLLRTSGLTSRQFKKNDDIQEFTLEVDFAEAHSRLKPLRDKSSSFILDALKQAENHSFESSQKEIHEARARRHAISYPVHFHSGEAKGDKITVSTTADTPIVKRLKSKALEYRWAEFSLTNDGSCPIPNNLFLAKNRRFSGWTLRFKVDNRWFWYLNDGSIVPSDISGEAVENRKAVFRDESEVPHIPVNRIAIAVFVAQWSEDKSLLGNLKFDRASRKASL